MSVALAKNAWKHDDWQIPLRERPSRARFGVRHRPGWWEQQNKSMNLMKPAPAPTAAFTGYARCSADRREVNVTTDDVLRRYESDLPEFSEMEHLQVDSVGHFGNRPLKCAAVRGVTEELEALLDGGADVDAKGEHGFTALHHAVSQGHMDAVRLLVRRGATLEIKNAWGSTARDIALERGQDDIVAILGGS